MSKRNANGPASRLIPAALLGILTGEQDKGEP